MREAAIPTAATLGISRELFLLTAAARLRLDAEDRARIGAIVAEGLDWSRLLRLARENRVDALLQQGLARTVPDSTPSEVAARLEAYRAANLTRNLRRIALLTDLARALERAGVPFLVFKGPVLASHVYGDLGLRFFWDLDVLVGQEDVAHAGELLAERGFRRPRAASRREDRFLARYHYAHSFEHPNEELEVDLHWRLFPANFAVAYDEPGTWARAVPCTIGGAALPTLSPEDTLLHLAVHGGKEEWRRLQMLCDVAEYLRALPGAFDWDGALARAAAHGARRMLLLAAHLAHVGLGAPLPARVREAIAADPIVADLERRVWAGLENPKLRTSLFRVTRFRQLVHERRRDQARYLLRTATRPRWEHVQSLPLPYALRAAYVPLRILHDSCLLPVWGLARLHARTGRPAT